MRYLVICFITLYWPYSATAASDAEVVVDLATSNGYKPSQRVITAIVSAGHMYHIDVRELTAIAIIETGLGRDLRTSVNRDGTADIGLFQINTINYSRCLEYNLHTPEGSAMCAAKLLWSLKQHRNDYLGAYHSKTPVKKQKYLDKLALVLLQ